MMDLSEQWRGLRAQALARRETLLLWLADAAAAQGLALESLAQHLGVSANYLHHLCAGVREVRLIRDEVAQAFASFLHLPVIAVRCAAGDVRIADVCTAEQLERCTWQVPVQLGAPELLQVSASVSAFAGLLAGIAIDSDEIEGVLKKAGAHDTQAQGMF